MFSEPLAYAVVALTIVNLFLIGWVLAAVRSQNGARNQLDLSLGGRFDGFDRHNEALRRTLTELDQGLRKEIATSSQQGLSAAFDKVQEGTKAQSDHLGKFGEQQDQRLLSVEQAVRTGNDSTRSALAEFRSEVTDRLDAVRETVAQVLLQAGHTFREIKDAIDGSTANTASTLGNQRDTITAQLAKISERLGKELGNLADRVRLGFEGFGERLRDEQAQLRDRVDNKLEEMRAGNETKLDQMRQAVDEQLQMALQKRLDESFQRVTEQFSQVQQAIGQVQNVSGQIGDLKRLFSNVKSRGGWGEAHLQALLDDVLPVGAYEANHRVGEEAGAVVEFALRMPVKGASEDVWLAIDAKFPTADYDRLRSACEAGNEEDEAGARKALERRIREEAKKISEKYIRPPHTVEYALMYLPTESLFAEAYRTPGLIEALYRQHHVTVVGPSLLPALLHYIRVGHLTFALERNAAVIGEILSAVKAEWGNFGKSLEVLARRAETLRNKIKETQKSALAVGRTLATVDAIDASRAREVLGLQDLAASIEADVEDEGGESRLDDANFPSDPDAPAIAAQ